MAESFYPREALPWLGKADSDLRTARAALDLDPPEVEAAAFHCQQVVEKCLKGLLAAHDIDPPRLHDVALLLEMCTEQGHDLSEFQDTILDFNPYAVLFRYPTEETAPEEDEVETALREAIKLSRRVRTLLFEKVKP